MERQHASEMRVVEHPGDRLDERCSQVSVELAGTFRVVVDEGSDLFETIQAELDARGAAGGSFTLIEGTIDRLSIMTGGPGQDGMPMGFHGPHSMNAPLTIVAGAAGSGVDLNGSRFTHCHAAFKDKEGKLVGGHLISGQTIAGTGGIAVDLVPFTGGRFARRLDPETLFTIFHPEPA